MNRPKDSASQDENPEMEASGEEEAAGKDSASSSAASSRDDEAGVKKGRGEEDGEQQSGEQQRGTSQSSETKKAEERAYNERDKEERGQKERGREALGPASRPALVGGTSYIFQSRNVPELEYAFHHGHIDGVNDVEQAPFEGFIDERVAYDHAEEEISKLDARREALKEQAANVKAWRQEEARAEEYIGRLEERAENAEAEAVDTKASIDAVEEHAEKGTPSRGSVLYALLYSIAGTIFIAGDIIMSREVVSEALRLQGSWEPWIFALGLAMLAVLMKPAYDRLVEKPYWEGRSSAFRWTIVIGAVLAAVTLGVLGAFRSEAFVNQTLISQLQQEALSAETAEVSALQTQITELRQATVQSWYGFASFVLSGLIFAAAGAVCLSIGLGHGRDAWHRHVKRKKTRKDLELQRDALLDQERALREKLTKKRAELRGLQRRLEDHPGLSELRSEIEAIEDALQELRKQRAEARSALYRHLYHNGYSIAKTSYALQPASGDGASPASSQPGPPRAPDPSQVMSSNASQAQTPSSSSSGAGSSSGARRKRERPYVALRRAISRSNS